MYKSHVIKKDVDTTRVCYPTVKKRQFALARVK